jgi:hypothetical protein
MGLLPRAMLWQLSLRQSRRQMLIGADSTSLIGT